MKCRIEYNTTQIVLILLLIECCFGFPNDFMTRMETRLIRNDAVLKSRKHSRTNHMMVPLLDDEGNNSPMMASREKISIDKRNFDDKNNLISSTDTTTTTSSNRRSFVSSGLLSTISTISFINTILYDNKQQQEQVANAYYVKSFPLELKSSDGQQQPDTRIRKVNEIILNEQNQIEKTKYMTNNKIISSLLWGTALWLLSGSRSNPVVTPLANVLYKKDTEIWLQERNDGYFAALPWEFLIIIGIVFIGFGYIFDTIVVAGTVASFSDTNTAAATGIDLSTIITTTTAISIQLACVTIIGSGALELGRIASGDKGQTKDENIRSNQLQDEFNVFVTQRLIVYTTSKTKNVHKSEIIAAFRRYYSKYRTRPEDTTAQVVQNDQQNDNVSDLEIERLIRNWARNQDGVDMTRAGFFYGVGINRDADVFVTR